MKIIFLAFFCIMTFSISIAQVNDDMIGTWNIIDYAVTSNENSDKKSEDKLKAPT